MASGYSVYGKDKFEREHMLPQETLVKQRDKGMRYCVKHYNACGTKVKTSWYKTEDGAHKGAVKKLDGTYTHARIYMLWRGAEGLEEQVSYVYYI